MAYHHPGGQLSKGDPGRLAHERHGSGGPGVHLQDVDDPGFDGELDVDQPHDPERLRERHRVALHFVDHPVSDQVGRHHARGVPRMDTGILDVLHDPADHTAGAVGDGVNVRLEGVLEEAVDQHRMLGSDPSRLLEELAERALIVHDFHRPPAQHVGRPNEHRVSDVVGDADCFLDRAGGAVGRLVHA